jgi:hypothetical protein
MLGACFPPSAGSTGYSLKTENAKNVLSGDDVTDDLQGDRQSLIERGWWFPYFTPAQQASRLCHLLIRAKPGRAADAVPMTCHPAPAQRR